MFRGELKWFLLDRQIYRLVGVGGDFSVFKKYNDGYKIRAGKSTPPGVEGYQDPLWAEENFDRYERLARFRRGSPDPKTRHRSVDGRFLADDEFDMDLPTIYVDGEEWDPADLGLEEADWTFHEVKEIKEFKRRTRRDKEKKARGIGKVVEVTYIQHKKQFVSDRIEAKVPGSF